MIGRSAVWLVMAAVVSACQGGPVGVPVGFGRATVNLDDAATRAVVISVLAKAVHRAHIELGPAEANTSVITVLPPPLGPHEMNSPARPTVFTIERADDHCRAVRQDTQEAFDLPGVACVATRS